MIYKPLLPLAFSALLCGIPVQATTTDGLIIGGFAGLTAGFISSAIARHANHRHHHHERTVYVEQPRIVEVQRPLVVEQVIEHRPVVVEERIRPRRVTYHHAPQPPAPVQIVATPSLAERELALKEQQMKLDLLKEENKQRELKIRELELDVQRISALKKS